jgi:hypothetical protein
MPKASTNAQVRGQESERGQLARLSIQQNDEFTKFVILGPEQRDPNRTGTPCPGDPRILSTHFPIVQSQKSNILSNLSL